MDLINLDEAKAQENISSTANDAELQLYIDAVTSFMRRRVGDIIPTTYTEVHAGGRSTLILDHAPVISVTSLVEYVGLTGYTLTLQPPGATTSNYGYSIDNPDAGIITRRSSAGTPVPFMGGTGAVTVTYVAGRSAADPDFAALKLAALMVVENLWVTQRGNSAGRPTPSYEQDVSTAVTTAGIPERAVYLLAGERPPAIA